MNLAPSEYAWETTSTQTSLAGVTLRAHILRTGSSNDYRYELVMSNEVKDTGADRPSLVLSQVCCS